MNTLIICASHRKEAQSAKVSQLISHLLEELQPEGDIETIFLADYPKALHSYGYQEQAEASEKKLIEEEKQLLQGALRRCTKLVVVTPEWGGMVPPALTNLLLLSAFGSAGGIPLAHKPGFIVGVSASSGGHYPISQLRGYGSKNSHLIWIPQHCIIRNVEAFLQHPWTPDDGGNFSDVQSRLQTGLICLNAYESALNTIRDELVPLSEKHPYGQ